MAGSYRSRPALVLRVEAAQATLDKFRGQPFAWGEADCARLAADVLRRLGYQTSLSKFGRYSTEAGARRALKAQGMASMLDAVDAVPGLVRIPPAATLPADIIAFPAAGDWPGLGVVLGNGRMLGFHDGVDGFGCAVIAANLGAAIAAWSCPPCRIS